VAARNDQHLSPLPLYPAPFMDHRYRTAADERTGNDGKKRFCETGCPPCWFRVADGEADGHQTGSMPVWHYLVHPPPPSSTKTCNSRLKGLGERCVSQQWLRLEQLPEHEPPADLCHRYGTTPCWNKRGSVCRASTHVSWLSKLLRFLSSEAECRSGRAGILAPPVPPTPLLCQPLAKWRSTFNFVRVP
jgi:hypothetical protein